MVGSNNDAHADTLDPVRLFYPRFDRWENHFLLGEYSLQARTEIGYGTILLLEMNHVDRLLERRLQLEIGVKL